MKIMDHTRRRPGRPLSFDRESALRLAMNLFWRQGYETTSVADLCGAMGITPPSLYAAFGDKKQLFLEAADHYAALGGGAERLIAAAPTASEAARDLMTASALAFTGEATPAGCLLASAAATGTPAAADVRAHLGEIRRRIEAQLATRFVDDGIGVAEAETFAALVIAVIQGMSILARDGASREKLLNIARAAQFAAAGV